MYNDTVSLSVTVVDKWSIKKLMVSILIILIQDYDCNVQMCHIFIAFFFVYNFMVAVNSLPLSMTLMSSNLNQNMPWVLGNPSFNFHTQIEFPN